MNLTLEQLIVLANSPEWPVPKSEIVRACLDGIGKSWGQILGIIDQLADDRYLDRHCGMYNIRPDGYRALINSWAKFNELNARIGQLIKARE